MEIFTQIRQAPYYYKREFKNWCGKFIYDWWYKESKQWLNSSHHTGNLRSLADIKEIESLRKQLLTAKAELDELGEQYEMARDEIMSLEEEIERQEQGE